MVQAEKILKGIRVTEKAANLQVSNKYTFEVAEDASAIAIGKAVEKLFKVKVVHVNVMNVKGKVKVSRMNRAHPGVKGKMKKAIVTLKQGDAIQIA
ncbi:MAG: 50S ribosomal protein L23 [Opitutales bacterium]|nr:50S ribosomal protein L23 [Opitutales bacterium]